MAESKPMTDDEIARLVFFEADWSGNDWPSVALRLCARIRADAARLVALTEERNRLKGEYDIRTENVLDLEERMIRVGDLLDGQCECECDGSHGPRGDCNFDDHEPCFAHAVGIALFGERKTPMAVELAALRAENARLTSEVERLRAVAEAARALKFCANMSLPALPYAQWPRSAHALHTVMDRLAAALDAAGGEGKR